MSSSSVDPALLETFRQSGPLGIELGEACWLVWPSERTSGGRAAMSSAQFIHLNAPVVAVQQNGRMEYFDSEGDLGWTSNLPWPRANLEMARLPGRPEVLEEGAPEKSSEESSN